LSSNTWNKPQSSTESNRWPSDPSSNGLPHQEAGFEASVPGLLLGDFDGNRSSIDARSLPSPAARPLSACSAVPQPPSSTRPRSSSGIGQRLERRLRAANVPGRRPAIERLEIVAALKVRAYLFSAPAKAFTMVCAHPR
jgi:hypothetical protein